MSQDQTKCIPRRVLVPWCTTKEIMSAILARALEQENNDGE